MVKAQKNKDVAGQEVPAVASPVEKRRPVASLRVEDCSASVWRRDHMIQGETVTFYSVTFERSYKDRDGGWKYTKSFDQESLGKLVSLCEQASTAIQELQAKDEQVQEAA